MNYSILASFREKNEQKSLLVITITGLFAILFAGQIEYWKSPFSEIDLSIYLEMAAASPGLNLDVIRPFVYRVLSPWLAGMIPLDPATSFLIINYFSLILLLYLFYFFLRINNISRIIALIATVLFSLNKYLFGHMAWNYFQLVDSMGTLFFILSLIFMIRKEWLPFLLSSIIAILIRETVLLLIPAGVVYYLSDKKELRSFLLSALPALSIFILLRILIPSEKGDSLTEQFSYGLGNFTGAEPLIKRLFIAFTPLSLIPLLLFREIGPFLKKHAYLAVLFLSVLCISFFGVDAERMMLPAAPAYYLFLAFLLQRMEFAVNSEKKPGTHYFLILLTALAAMPYHLWGIVALPDKTYSLILSVVTILLMSGLWVHLKYASAKGRE